MGFWDQLIGLGILGLLSHYFFIKRGKKPRNNAWLAYYGLISVFGILGGGITMYLGGGDLLLPLLNSIPWIASDPFLSGRDFMWNSFRLIGGNPRIEVNAALDSIAVLLFLCYIPVFGFFKWISQCLFGRYAHEKGLLWALAPVKPIKKKTSPEKR
jgi:hypothetical protein